MKQKEEDREEKRKEKKIKLKRQVVSIFMSLFGLVCLFGCCIFLERMFT